MKLKPFFWKILAGFFFLAVLGVGIIVSPNGWFEKITWIGSSVCHQLSTHSFILNGHQFPLCSRCTGTYLSAFIGLIFFSIKGKRTAIPKKGVFALFLFFFLFWAVDGVNSFFNDFFQKPLLYQPSNLLRFLSGIGMGMVFSLIIMTIVNLVFWKENENKALLDTWHEVGVLLLIESVLILFPFNKSMFIFNLAGLISTATVVVLIGLLYAILIVIVIHKEATYQTIQDALIPLLLGFGIAIFQIIFMANLRMRFTNFSNYPL
ncbi:MAG: DUF2085 domain-containing protein [Anaerolineaceae bacterium]